MKKQKLEKIIIFICLMMTITMVYAASPVITALQAAGNINIAIIAAPISTTPSYSNLPSLKLFMGQNLNDAFNMEDYNSQEPATSYSMAQNFLGLASFDGSSASQAAYGIATSGVNSYVGTNTNGASTSDNKVKYSTYKIMKLPKIGLNVGDTYNLPIVDYTYDASGPNATPASYGQLGALVSNNPSVVDATWSGNTVVLHLLSASPSAPATVDIIASPIATPTAAVDIDKERIYVYTNLLANGTFATAADTAQWAWELSPKPNLIMPLFLASDPSGGGATGVLDFNFPDNQGGVKITPLSGNWISVANDWYTVRARLRADSAATANSHQAYIFGYSNTVGAGIPTSVVAHVLLGVPDTYSWVEAPFYAAAASASGYPQLSIRGGGAGHVYLDEVQMFRGAPTLVDANRSNTRLFYAGGNFNNTISTTLWGQSPYGAGDVGRPTITLNSGAMVLDFAGAAAPPNALGLKWTASTTGGATGIVTPAPKTIGTEVGGRLVYNIGSGTFSTTPLVIMNLLGTMTDGSATIGASGSDIIAAAQLDQLINGSIRAIGNAYSPFYQFQLAIRSPEAGTLNITAVDFDSDQDNPNFGDINLFP